MRPLLSNILFLILFANIGQKTIAQSTTWLFGSQAGIEFRGASVSPVCSGKLTAGEGSSVATDAAGNLLFYTDGMRIYNSAHNPISFKGSTDFLGGHPSSTHSALILPLPGSGCYKFLVFTTDASENLNESNYRGLECTLISVQGTNIVVLEGPVPMYSMNVGGGVFRRSTEKIAATSDGNGGYWVVHHITGNTSNDQAGFLTMHVTHQTQTVGMIKQSISFASIGSKHLGYTQNTYNVQGQMKFSPDGSRLALVVPELAKDPSVIDNFIEVFSFDRSNGKIGRVIATIQREHIIRRLGIDSTIKNLYGIEFSPNSSLIYVSEGYTPSREMFGGTTMFLGNVYQFDLNAVFILNSVFQVAQLTSFNQSYPCGALQLGPNQRIYLARPEMNYLSCIESPNAMGRACNFNENAVSLIDTKISGCGNKISKLGLPTTCIASECKSETAGGCECNPDYSLNIRKNGLSSYLDLQLNSKGACVKSVKLSILSYNLLFTDCEHNSLENEIGYPKFSRQEESNFNGVIKNYSFNGQISTWSKLPNIGVLDHTMFVAPLDLPDLNDCQQAEICFKLELTTCNCVVCEKIVCVRLTKNGIVSPGFNNVNEQAEPVNSETNTFQKIKISPNPVNNAFRIEHTLVGDAFEVCLLNSSGKIIYTEKTSEHSIDLQMALSKGLYIVKVRNSKNEWVSSKLSVME